MVFEAAVRGGGGLRNDEYNDSNEQDCSGKSNDSSFASQADMDKTGSLGNVENSGAQMSVQSD
jgi:hypothetical protein